MLTEPREPQTRADAVVRILDDRAFLYRIIETIGSGPDLESILRGVVRLVTEATGCHACAVYFVHDTQLHLRVASSIYAHLEGKVSFLVGEGLTGWVVRNRRPGFIRENALEDPRFRHVPELEEEHFQSLVSVPIFSRAGIVIGVITLHTEAPHEFDQTDLEFLEHTASLVAGAIENARLYENATERVAVLTELSRLSQRIASAGSTADLLSTVVTGCRTALHAERAEVFLLDADDRLSLHAANPERRETRTLDPRQLWVDVLAAGSERSPLEAARHLAETLWGSDIAGQPLFAPLQVERDRLGILCALCPARSADGQPVLSAIAAHTALALRHHDLVLKLREESLVKDFFQALTRGQASDEELAAQALRLGCPLERGHVVLHAMPWRSPRTAGPRPGAPRPVRAAPSPWADTVARLEAPLATVLPGTLFEHRSASLRALLRPPAARESEAVAAVRRVHAQLTEERRDALTIGVSAVCRDVASLRRGFEEAAAAAEVGALITGSPGVHTYESLGPYRYLLHSEERLHDRHQERLERLADYDRRRGTKLLRTLEVYLDGRENIVATARTLYVHPNTLRQRLARIERICGYDFEREEDWLSLGIAVKLVKLRAARRSAREHETVSQG